MDISFSPYTLVFRDGTAEREGALLRFVFSDDTMGFADCHPWEELGDLSLKKQLKLLSDGSFTRLTERSLHFAKLDARVRTNGSFLWEKLNIPASHYLMRDPWQPILKGFSRIKIKVGRRSCEESQQLRKLFSELPEDVKVRLDFNARLSYDEFQNFLESFGKDISRLDFVEDPFPFDPDQWQKVQNQWGISLACDDQSDKHLDSPLESYAVSVIKPAVQDEEKFLGERRRLVVTSYLDHPLGQLCAAYVAAKLSDRCDICGLLTHLVYQPNEFSERLTNNGPYLVPPSIGFDDLLEKQPWSPVSCL